MDEVLKKCRLSDDSLKLLSFTNEKTFLISPKNKKFTDLNNYNDENSSIFEENFEDLIILKINQKIIKNLKKYGGNSRKIWDLISSNIEITSYNKYLENSYLNTMTKFHSNYLFIQESPKKIKVINKLGNNNEFYFETESEIVFGSSIDKNGEFYKLSIQGDFFFKEQEIVNKKLIFLINLKKINNFYF